MSPRPATPPSPPRRGRTRWLLVTPLVGLAVIVGGVIWLEALAPQVATPDLWVDGVPPLALAEERPCTAQDDDLTDELRHVFPDGGRVSSTQVVRCPRAFDGREVTYVGEVIGEVLPRDGGAWVQANDDTYALEVGPLVGHRERDGFNSGLAVWLPDGLHEEVEEAGRPGRRGDVILVTGTLRRADPDDGGGITVRAEELEILAGSVEIDDPLHIPQLIVAIVLSIVACSSVIWSRRILRRS